MPQTQTTLPGVRTAAEASARQSMQRTLHRRRVLLVTMLVIALVSLVLAFVTEQGRAWGVHVAADALLLGYLAVLINFRNAAAEQEMTRRGLGG